MYILFTYGFSKLLLLFVDENALFTRRYGKPPWPTSDRNASSPVSGGQCRHLITMINTNPKRLSRRNLTLSVRKPALYVRIRRL